MFAWFLHASMLVAEVAVAPRGGFLSVSSNRARRPHHGARVGGKSVPRGGGSSGRRPPRTRAQACCLRGRCRPQPRQTTVKVMRARAPTNLEMSACTSPSAPASQPSRGFVNDPVVADLLPPDERMNQHGEWRRLLAPWPCVCVDVDVGERPFLAYPLSDGTFLFQLDANAVAAVHGRRKLTSPLDERTATMASSTAAVLRLAAVTAATSALVLTLTGLSVGLAAAGRESASPFFEDEDFGEGAPLSLAKREAQRFRSRLPPNNGLDLAGGAPRPLDVGGKEPFALNEIVDGDYRPKRWNGSWVSDSEYAYRGGGGELRLLSVVTGASRTLLSAEDMAGAFRYWLSPERTHVLLAVRPQRLFRHSFIATYDIVDLTTGRRVPLQPPRDLARQLLGPPPPGEADFPGGEAGGPQLPLLYAAWSPVGTGLAYVFSNNIFYRASPEARDVIISTSGEKAAFCYYLAR